MSINLADLEGLETEEEVQPAPASPQTIEIDGRQVALEELKEALRYRDRDYPNLQKAFSVSQNQLQEMQQRAQALESELANLASMTGQVPGEVDYGRYYGQGPAVPQPYYPQQPVAPPQPREPRIDPEEVSRRIRREIEQSYNPRLEALEKVLQQQENLAYIEQQFVNLKEKYPDVDPPMVKRISDFLRERHQSGGGWVDPELVYSHLKHHDFVAAAQEGETKKRRKASASEPGVGEPVSLRPNKPKTDDEWKADLERGIKDEWSEITGEGL